MKVAAVAVVAAAVGALAAFVAAGATSDDATRTVTEVRRTVRVERAEPVTVFTTAAAEAATPPEPTRLGTCADWITAPDFASHTEFLDSIRWRADYVEAGLSGFDAVCEHADRRGGATDVQLRARSTIGSALTMALTAGKITLAQQCEIRDGMGGRYACR